MTSTKNEAEQRMHPLVSLIVPHYNHKNSLPVLLDSVLAQSELPLEVIIVDDKSDESCADVVDAYRVRGMDIRLVEQAERQYTKNIRLAGIREAKADIVAFADADDHLLGTDILASHVDMMRREKADIVCFPGLSPDQEGRYVVPCKWSNPMAPRLEGEDIFARYIDRKLNSHVIWNKIYTRDLWLKIIDTAQKSAVRRYQEDLYLTSLLMFHARRYIGSQQAGYAYRGAGGSNAAKAAGRAATLYAILREVVPYLVSNGCPDALARRFEDQIKQRLTAMVKSLCDNAVSKEGDVVSDETLHGLSLHADKDTFLKIFMICIADGKDKPSKRNFPFLGKYLKL